jgi:hypothetical protein
VDAAFVWLKFFLRVLIVLFAGTKLARYGDVIAAKTGLEGVGWVGCRDRAKALSARFAAKHHWKE